MLLLSRSTLIYIVLVEQWLLCKQLSGMSITFIDFFLLPKLTFWSKKSLLTKSEKKSHFFPSNGLATLNWPKSFQSPMKFGFIGMCRKCPHCSKTQTDSNLPSNFNGLPSHFASDIRHNNKQNKEFYCISQRQCGHFCIFLWKDLELGKNLGQFSVVRPLETSYIPRHQ